MVDIFVSFSELQLFYEYSKSDKSKRFYLTTFTVFPFLLLNFITNDI